MIRKKWRFPQIKTLKENSKMRFYEFKNLKIKKLKSITKPNIKNTNEFKLKKINKVINFKYFNKLANNKKINMIKQGTLYLNKTLVNIYNGFKNIRKLKTQMNKNKITNKELINFIKNECIENNWINIRDFKNILEKFIKEKNLNNNNKIKLWNIINLPYYNKKEQCNINDCINLFKLENEDDYIINMNKNSKYPYNTEDKDKYFKNCKQLNIKKELENLKYYLNNNLKNNTNSILKAIDIDDDKSISFKDFKYFLKKINITQDKEKIKTLAKSFELDTRNLNLKDIKIFKKFEKQTKVKNSYDFKQLTYNYKKKFNEKLIIKKQYLKDNNIFSFDEKSPLKISISKNYLRTNLDDNFYSDIKNKLTKKGTFLQRHKKFNI